MKEYYTIDNGVEVYQHSGATTADGLSLCFNGVGGYYPKPRCQRLTPEDVEAWKANKYSRWAISKDDEFLKDKALPKIERFSSKFPSDKVLGCMDEDRCLVLGLSLDNYCFSLLSDVHKNSSIKFLTLKEFLNPFFTFGGLKPISDKVEGDIDHKSSKMSDEATNVPAVGHGSNRESVSVGSEAGLSEPKDFHVGVFRGKEEPRILPDLEDQFTDSGELTEQGDPIVVFDNKALNGQYVNRTARELNDSLGHISFYEKMLGKICNAIKDAHGLDQRPEIEEVCEMIKEVAMADASAIYDLENLEKRHSKIEAEQTKQHAEQSQRLLDVNAELTRTQERLETVVTEGNAMLNELSGKYTRLAVRYADVVTAIQPKPNGGESNV